MSGRRLGAVGGAAALVLGLFAVVGVLGAMGVVGGEHGRFVAAPYAAPEAGLWLGADALGRDLAVRALAGAQVSLAVGLGGALAAVGLGALLGAALVVGPGVGGVVAAIGLTQWTGVFRAVRAEARRLRAAEFVRAAEAMGAGTLHQLRVHLVPHLAPLLRASFALLFVHAVKVEAVLAFFGYSSQATPSWGLLLAECGGEVTRGIWWPLVAASAPLAALVLAAQALADRLGDQEGRGDYL